MNLNSWSFIFGVLPVFLRFLQFDPFTLNPWPSLKFDQNSKRTLLNIIILIKFYQKIVPFYNSEKNAKWPPSATIPRESDDGTAVDQSTFCSRWFRPIRDRDGKNRLRKRFASHNASFVAIRDDRKIVNREMKRPSLKRVRWGEVKWGRGEVRMRGRGWGVEVSRGEIKGGEVR